MTDVINQYSLLGISLVVLVLGSLVSRAVSLK